MFILNNSNEADPSRNLNGFINDKTNQLIGQMTIMSSFY